LELYRTEVVILRAWDLGEADKLVRMLSREHGKLPVVAKGVRRPRSRMAAAVLPFTHAEVLLYRGRTLERLRQAQVLDSFQAIHGELVRLAQATYFCQLVDEFTEERAPVPEVYHVLLEALRQLARGAAPLLPRAFEMKLLTATGYQPQLDGCAVCARAVARKAHFSASAGGLVCESCAASLEDAEPVSLGTVRIMQRLLALPLDRVQTLAAARPMDQELKRHLRRHLLYRLDKNVASFQFLDMLEGLTSV